MAGVATVVVVACTGAGGTAEFERLEQSRLTVTRDGTDVCLTIDDGAASGSSCTKRDAQEPMLAGSGEAMAFLDPTGRIRRAELEFRDGTVMVEFGPQGVVAWSPARRPVSARFFGADGELLHEFG